MPEPNTDQETERVRTNSANYSADSKAIVNRVKPAKPSLWEEIRRGWEWVVFIWRMLPRIGGFGEWVRTLFFIASLLVERLLTQLRRTKKE